MTSIYKYVVPIGDFMLKLPARSRFLCIKNQRGQAVLWFEVEPELPTEDWHFSAHPTGGDIEREFKPYLGTVLFNNGDLVFHFYGEKRDPR